MIMVDRLKDSQMAKSSLISPPVDYLVAHRPAEELAEHIVALHVTSTTHALGDV